MPSISASSMRRLAVLSVAGLLAACSESGAPGYVPTSASIVGTPIPAVEADTGKLKVCKFGTAATFTITIDGVASSVTLQDGECQVVGQHTAGQGNHQFTIAENSDPAIVFDSLEVFFKTVANKTTTFYQTSGFTSSFSDNFNGDVGRVVEFFNHPAPPPPPPDQGCTVTLGWYKNHSNQWPSGFDPNATFQLSGKTWLGVLKTQPNGNGYYILAHQYITAVLNGGAGASAPANVQAAINGAAAYFAANGPTPAPSGALRTQLVNWSNLLDDYNNGLVGPGHCAD